MVQEHRGEAYGGTAEPKIWAGQDICSFCQHYRRKSRDAICAMLSKAAIVVDIVSKRSPLHANTSSLVSQRFTLVIPVNSSFPHHQGEFKATHKQVEQVRGSDLRPGELRAEIGQLEDEKKQLTEKIIKLKSNVADEPGEP